MIFRFFTYIFCWPQLEMSTLTKFSSSWVIRNKNISFWINIQCVYLLWNWSIAPLVLKMDTNTKYKSCKVINYRNLKIIWINTGRTKHVYIFNIMSCILNSAYFSFFSYEILICYTEWLRCHSNCYVQIVSVLVSSIWLTKMKTKKMYDRPRSL